MSNDTERVLYLSIPYWDRDLLTDENIVLPGIPTKEPLVPRVGEDDVKFIVQLVTTDAKILVDLLDRVCLNLYIPFVCAESLVIRSCHPASGILTRGGVSKFYARFRPRTGSSPSGIICLD